jgi:hypothetical protein
MLTSFEPSLVAVPVGARFARPVVVALHGQTETPQASCQVWQTITAQSYFVLCPSLRRRSVGNDRSSEPCLDWECAASELKEALLALRKRFGAYVAPKQVMLAGLGRGASLAVPIAQQNPSVFPIVWLIDGGFTSWSSSLSASYVERGGKLLGLACTGPECQGEVVRIVASANAVGLKVADYRSTRGGELNQALAVSLRATWETAKPQQWPWVLPGANKPSRPSPGSGYRRQ